MTHIILVFKYLEKAFPLGEKHIVCIVSSSQDRRIFISRPEPFERIVRVIAENIRIIYCEFIVSARSSEYCILPFSTFLTSENICIRPSQAAVMILLLP